MMRYTAKLSREGSGFAANCLEIEAEGYGTTRETAIASLRALLEDRVGQIEGMALPSHPDIAIEVVIVDEAW
jgi:hypothetical protein